MNSVRRGDHPFAASPWLGKYFPSSVSFEHFGLHQGVLLAPSASPHQQSGGGELVK